MANSDYGHVRAALQTSFDHYLQAHYMTGFYTENGGLQSIGGTPYVANMESRVSDAVQLTGGAGAYEMTLNFRMEGQIGSSFGFDRSGGTPTPVAWGQFLAAAFGSPADTQTIPLTENQTLDGELFSFTFRGLAFNAEVPYTFGVQFSQFSPSGGDPFTTLMTGNVNFDLAHTATLEKIIFTVPEGTDLSGLNARFASGTNFAVAFQTGAQNVPEPGGVTLVGLGIASMLFGLRRPSFVKRQCDPSARC